MSATRPGFTLTALTPLVDLDSIFVGPTGLPQALDAYISAFLNGPVGGPNVQVDLWQFDIAVDPGMALGTVTLTAEGGSAFSDFSEILYDVAVDLQVVDGAGGQLPEGGTLPSVAIALAALALVRRAVPQARPAAGESALQMQTSGSPSA